MNLVKKNNYIAGWFYIFKDIEYMKEEPALWVDSANVVIDLERYAHILTGEDSLVEPLSSLWRLYHDKI